MIVFVDDESRIKAVNSTTDESLIPLYINDDPKSNPFIGWSRAKICCYKVAIEDGVVTMMTPWVDSRMIDSIDQMGKEIDAITPWEKTESASKGDSEVQFIDVPNGVYNIIFDSLGDETVEYIVDLNDDIVTVVFSRPLEYAADVTLKVN